MTAGRVTIAGIGPGATEGQLTVEVFELIRAADVVIYAGTMMSPELRAGVRGELLFDTDLSDEVIRSRVKKAVENGQHVAWLEPGDPSLYSGEPGLFGSVSENTAWLRASEIPYEVLPGVSSLHALTARLKLEHSGPAAGTPLLIYAPGRDDPASAETRLRTLFALQSPVALFLGIERFKRIVELATSYYGREERIILGYKVGWPDERLIDSTLAEVLDVTDGTDLPRQTLILIGPWHDGTRRDERTSTPFGIKPPQFVDAGAVRRRAYADYDAYLVHQAEKLRLLRARLEPSDREYEELVCARFREILGRGAMPFRGQSMLCLGARLGGEVRAFKRLGALAVGIDIEPGAKNPHVLHGDFHDVAFPDGSFDHAFTNAIDHVFELDRFLDEVERILKPGGLFHVELSWAEPGDHEVIDTSDPEPVLRLLHSRFEEVESHPIHNLTSYLDWSGRLHSFRPIAR